MATELLGGGGCDGTKHPSGESRCGDPADYSTATVIFASQTGCQDVLFFCIWSRMKLKKRASQNSHR
jgi:hypothetical protein